MYGGGPSIFVLAAPREKLPCPAVARAPLGMQNMSKVMDMAYGQIQNGEHLLVARTNNLIKPKA
jgi:hypothetical protein